METKDILNRLPGSWQELKLKDFIKLSELDIITNSELSNIVVGAENAFAALSVLSGVPVDELESLPMSKATPLLKKIEFVFTTVPDVNGKSTIEWKKFDEMTYGNFITYQMFSNEPMKNLPIIIQIASKKELTDEEIENMGMQDVMTGFFLQQKQLKRFIRHMKLSLIKKGIKQKMMQFLSFKKK